MADDFFQEDEKQGAPLVDFRRVLSNAIRYWYLILFSLLIALAVAWVVNRYSDRIYPVSMSIIIRESQEAGQQAELLYNNPLVNPYRNFFNELYIIKSYPLIQQVVEELSFPIVIMEEGKVKTTERYKELPFYFNYLGTQQDAVFGRRYYLRLTDQDSFILEEPGKEKTRIGNIKTYLFGKEAEIDCISFIAFKDSTENMAKYFNKEYLFSTRNPFSLARSYSGRLQAEWAEVGASVINLSITGSIPRKEKDFLRHLVDVYAGRDIEKKNLAAEGSIEFIEEQLGYIQDSLKIYEDQLERFKSLNVVTDLGAEAGRMLRRLEEFEMQKSQIIVHENYLQYLEVYLQKPDNDFSLVILPTAIGITDPIIVRLVTNLLEVQSQARTLGSGVENPYATELLRQIHELKKGIRESLSIMRSTNQISIEQIELQIKKIEDKLGFLPGEEMRYLSIMRNYSVSESLYTFLIQKRYEAGITRASATSDIAVINPAVGGGAIKPKITQNFMMAIIFGLGFPFGILVLAELLNTKIQSREDITRITDVPFIGTIGHVKAGSSFIVADKPGAAIAESFR